jgi:hypothetical protein
VEAEPVEPDPVVAQATVSPPFVRSAATVIEPTVLSPDPVVAPFTPAMVAPVPGPALPQGPIGPAEVVRNVFSAAVAQVSHVVRPEAAVAVAAEFTFPLALALAVLLFLVVQDRVDRRDPKLRMAPQHSADTLISFQNEDQP